MEKVLIIGGCGYIGSRLHQYLLSQGMDITSVDLRWFGSFTNFYSVEQDFSELEKGFLAQFKTVILLAGHSSVKMCASNMRSTFNNNVVNFIALLDKLSKGQQFIYASSSSIYSSVNGELVNEESPKYRATNFYDLSKYEIDSYAKLHGRGVEYYGLRFGTVNGFSVNFRDDVMLNMMYRTALQESVVRISNPFISRPILGLDDLCRAMLRIIRDGDHSKRGIYNLASFNSTVQEIGVTAADIMGVQLVKTEDRPDVYDFTISSEKFCRTFAFEFNSKIESIMEEIRGGQSKLNFTNRNSPIKYGPQT